MRHCGEGAAPVGQESYVYVAPSSSSTGWKVDAEDSDIDGTDPVSQPWRSWDYVLVFIESLWKLETEKKLMKIKNKSLHNSIMSNSSKTTKFIKKG